MAGKSTNTEKNKKWLIAVLFVLTLITSCVVGFVLGQKTYKPPMGQIIDTIPLTPDKEINTTMHISGHVAYTDGTPAAYQLVELHSDPMTTITNEEGLFLFANVPLGTHKIAIQNNNGEVIASQNFVLSKENTSSAINIDKLANGDYSITLSADIRIIEIAIEIDDDELEIKSDLTYANYDGLISTPKGSASTTEGVIVTSGGNIYLPDGTIIVPKYKDGSIAAVILPDNSVVYPDAPLVFDDATVQIDGTTELADGTVIKPEGDIITPDGNVNQNGDGVIITPEDHIVTPIGDKTKPNIPVEPDKPNIQEPAEPDPDETVTKPIEPNVPDASVQPDEQPEPPTPSTPSDNVKPDDHPNGGGGGGSNIPDVPNPPVPPDEDSDKGILDVTNSEGISWTQNSTIDLFHNRTSGPADKIQPGSSGYYLFKLDNTRLKDLKIKLKLTELNTHIPLVFTLSQTDKDGNILNNVTAVNAKLNNNSLELSADEVVKSMGSIYYRLDWHWSYEGNEDAADTLAGIQGGEYRLNITVIAEELN